MEKYTTSERISAQSSLKHEEQTEKNKVVISNDAYAITDLISQLLNKMEHVRSSLIR